MARSDKRYMVYPSPRATDIIGSTAPALNQAIECWAALLVRAIADNSNKTFPRYPEGECMEWADLNEWAFMAEVLKDMRFDPDFANPGELLATAVEDANRLENLGEKWFSSHAEGEDYLRCLDHKVKELVKKIRSLDYPHAWAIIVAVQWFWEHREVGIDIEKDTWWTVTFRRQWHQKSTPDKSPPKRRKRES